MSKTIDGSDLILVMERILDRADMNVRTSLLHPDPLVREQARARAEGYRMAASELEDLLLRSYDSPQEVMEEKLRERSDARSDAFVKFFYGADPTKASR